MTVNHYSVTAGSVTPRLMKLQEKHYRRVLKLNSEPGTDYIII